MSVRTKPSKLPGTIIFDQTLETKNEIPNEAGPRLMRDYTPWRVEEVGKLHHDENIRILTDSKVKALPASFSSVCSQLVIK